MNLMHNLTWRQAPKALHTSLNVWLAFSAPAWKSFRVSFGTFPTLRLMDESTPRLRKSMPCFCWLLSDALLNWRESWRRLPLAMGCSASVSSTSLCELLLQIWDKHLMFEAILLIQPQANNLTHCPNVRNWGESWNDEPVSQRLCLDRFDSNPFVNTSNVATFV